MPISRSVITSAAISALGLWLAACESTKVEHRDTACEFSFTPLVGAYQNDVTLEVSSTLLSQVEVSIAYEATEPPLDELSPNQPTVATATDGISNPYTGPITLSEGHHKILVYDPCRSLWWKTSVWIDRTPPDLAIFPASGYYRPPLTVTVNHTGQLLMRIYGEALTAGTFASIGSAISLTSPGSWVVDARALDVAGNTTNATAHYVLDDTAPALASIVMHSTRAGSSLLPRFDLTFDRSMDTTKTLFAAMLTQTGSDLAHDVFVHWENSYVAYAFPTTTLAPNTTYYLNIPKFTGLYGSPLIQDGANDLELIYAFTTAELAQELMFSRSSVTTPAAGIDATGQIPAAIDLYLHFDSPPSFIDLLTFRLVYSDGAGNAVFSNYLADAIVIDDSKVKLEINTADLPFDRSFALTVFAFDPIQQYTPGNYVGMYIQSVTRNTGRPFQLMAANALPGQHSDSGSVLLMFSQVPAANEFADAVTAELLRNGVLTPVTDVVADYLPESNGYALRLAAPGLSLQDNDNVRYYGNSAQIFDVLGQTLDQDFQVAFTKTPLPATFPAFVAASLVPGNPEVAASANRDILYLSHTRTQYDLVDWRFELPQNGSTPLPAFRKVLANLEGPNRTGDYAHHTFRTIAQMDALPDGLPLEFVGTFEDAVSHARWERRLPFTVRNDAVQKSDLGTAGVGVALRTPSSVSAIRSELEFRQMPDAQNSLDLTFPDLLPATGLNIAPQMSIFRQNGQLPVLPPPDETHTHYSGRIVGSLSHSDGNEAIAYGDLVLDVLPMAAIPYVSTPAATSLPLTAATQFSWSVTDTDTLQAISLQFYSTDLTGENFEFRYPPSATMATLYGGDLTTGTYIWLVLGVSSAGDAFAPFSRKALDHGYATAASYSITITP